MTTVLDGELWFAAACELEGENRELRRTLTALLFFLAEREALLEHARDLIERRFPAGREAA